MSFKASHGTEAESWPMLTLQVPVLVLRFGESRVLVEQCGHKRQVEFGISTNDIGGGHELSTAEAVCLFEHTFCSFRKVLLLLVTYKLTLTQDGESSSHHQSLLKHTTTITGLSPHSQKLSLHH